MSNTAIYYLYYVGLHQAYITVLHNVSQTYINNRLSLGLHFDMGFINE